MNFSRDFIAFRAMPAVFLRAQGWWGASPSSYALDAIFDVLLVLSWQIYPIKLVKKSKNHAPLTSVRAVEQYLFIHGFKSSPLYFFIIFLLFSPLNSPALIDISKSVNGWIYLLSGEPSSIKLNSLHNLSWFPPMIFPFSVMSVQKHISYSKHLISIKFSHFNIFWLTLIDLQTSF